MRTTNEADVEAARWLLAQGAPQGAPNADSPAAAGRGYLALRRTLAPIVGVAGVSALFARTTRIHRADFPVLEEAMTIDASAADGAEVARGLAASLGRLPPGDAEAASVALFSTFIGLLTNLIGERLVWQLVRGAYPGGHVPAETE